MNKEYYLKSYSDVVKNFNTNIDTGLSGREASKLLDKYGKNILPSKKKNGIIKIFFSGLLDPIVILLIITSIISFLVGEKVDGIVIIFIILLDLILGTVEEYQANKKADSLKELIKQSVKVFRDSEESIIDSSLLVPGDIVLLESGNKISADIRIINSSNLQVDESVLTGESISVSKNSEKINKEVPISERSNMLFAGSTIVTGRCLGVVCETGINTVVGNIFNTVENIKEEKSPLTIRMNKLSKQISFMIIIIAFIIALVLKSKGLSGTEIFMAVVALSVSAMPEGLPLALTMALTITSNLMVKKNVVVKKLNYVESLGSCTVIATDKTGTLTVNEQTAKIICLPNNHKYDISGVGYKVNGEVLKVDIANRPLIDKIILHGKLNNESMKTKKGEYYGDSIDIAFSILSEKNKTYSDEYEVIKIIPYESENRYSGVFYKYNNEIYCTVKGSIEVILSFCNKMILDNKEVSINVKELMKQNEELSKLGYRVIAIASGKIKNFKEKDFYDIKDVYNLNFEGMVGFIDPIRDDVKESIDKCCDAGIKVLMITGDHPLTAYSIAKELNLVNDYDEVAIGSDIEKYSKLGNEAFDRFIKNKKVFARVNPFDKLKIVESLKRMDEFVAVTGDGVNDAPAIRSANIGISMGSGTDTAKETAGMIIVDDSFKSIVSGVELGRCAYANIRKVCYFLLSCGLAEVLFFLLSIVFNLPMPLVAIQLLWLNLVTDGFQDIALSFEKSEKGIMKKKPIRKDENIFNRKLIEEVLVSGLFIGVIVFSIWYVLINNFNLDVSVARGYIMVLMVFIQNIHVFNCRSETESAFNIPLKSNPLIVVTTFGSILLQIIVMEVPLLSKYLKTVPISYSDMFMLLLFAMIILIVMEIYKLIRYPKKV